MVFLHINQEEKNHKELDKCIKDKDKKIFLLIFMIGCGPCEATKPEWLNIKSKLDNELNNDNNIVIADLEQSLLNDLENLPKQPMGFPTMYYITDGGNICEEFDDGRDVDSFIKWIESKTNSIQQGGKKNKKSKKSKKNKKNKKSKKIKKSKNRNNNTRKRSRK